MEFFVYNKRKIVVKPTVHQNLVVSKALLKNLKSVILNISFESCKLLRSLQAYRLLGQSTKQPLSNFQGWGVTLVDCKKVYFWRKKVSFFFWRNLLSDLKNIGKLNNFWIKFPFTSRSVILSNINNGTFCENREYLLAVNYSRKKLHHRSLTGRLPNAPVTSIILSSSNFVSRFCIHLTSANFN